MLAKISLSCFLLFALALVADADQKEVAKDEITSACVGRAPRVATKSYLVICDKKANWLGAVNHCNKLGMRLATVENKEQESALVRAIASSTCCKENTWIGGTNQQDEKEWVWEANGKSVSYTRGWLKGEAPKFNKDKRCMEMLPQTCGFNDQCCDKELNFVCESVSRKHPERQSNVKS